jgi:hypothetical protein
VLYGYVWVHLHGFLGILTFAINLIAFALIVDWVSDRGISHFKGGAVPLLLAHNAFERHTHPLTLTIARAHHRHKRTPARAHPRIPPTDIVRVRVAHEIIGIIMFICSFFLPIFGVVGELFLKKCTYP